MKVITETIYGQVVSKANNYMIGASGDARHIIKSPALRAYERSFMEQCKIYKDKMISGNFTLLVAVYESSHAFDLDNSLKTLLDCMQYCRVISNDNNCMKIVAEKRIDPQNPRVIFAIKEHEPTLF